MYRVFTRFQHNHSYILLLKDCEKLKKNIKIVNLKNALLEKENKNLINIINLMTKLNEKPDKK